MATQTLAGVQAIGADKPLDLGSSVSVAKTAAPGISPSTALTVAQQGGDVAGNAQAVTQSYRHAALAQQAQLTDQSQPGGLAGLLHDAGHLATDVVDPIGHAISDAGKVLNAPLQLVQHEYRYLRDVEARHGMATALAEGLGIIAGGVAGGLATANPEGAVLGAEAVGGIEGQVFTKTAWSQTTTGAKYHTPTTGDVISIGRTVARALGLTHHSAAFGTLSGVVDGIADLALTPLGNAGKLVGAARGAKGIGGVVGGEFGSKLGGLSVAKAIANPDALDDLYRNNGGFRRAVTEIAAMDAGPGGTEALAIRYPKLAPIAKTLSLATTPTEVLGVLKSPVKAKELLTSTESLPSQSFVHQRLQATARNLSATPGGIVGGENFLFGPARWARRLSNVPGSTLDPMTKALSASIDPADPRGANDVYRMVLYSQDQKTAEKVANSYIWAAPNDRIQLVRNVYMDVLAKMAHIEPMTDLKSPEGLYAPVTDDEEAWNTITTPEVRKAIKGRLDFLTGGKDPLGGEGGRFMLDKNGDPLDRLYTHETDRWVTAAALPSQTGKIAIPSFVEAKRTAEMIKGGRQYLGKADTYLYHYVTQGFFKPLVLLSPSYALHMVASEMIPNMLRNGVWKTVSSAFKGAAAHLHYELPNLQSEQYLADYIKDSHLPKFAAKALGTGEVHFAGLLDRTFGHFKFNQQDMESLAKLQLLLDGHTTPDYISAGHGTSTVYTYDENASATLKAMGHRGQELRRTNDFVRYQSSDPEYMEAWRDAIREFGRNAVGREAADAYARVAGAGGSEEDAIDAASQAATEWLRATMSPAMHEMYRATILHSAKYPPLGQDTISDWGRRIGEGVRGIIGDHANVDVARTIADGEAPSRQMLADIPDTARPIAVKGRDYRLPDGSSAVKRIADLGFRKILNPMIQRMARDPLYNTEFLKSYNQMKPLIEAGIMDDDEAVVTAANQAAQRSIKFIHNVHTRTQWTETARNWFPFAFAQEQAYKRAGRLLAATPGAFRRYQLMIQAVGNYVAEQHTKTGKKYFSLPGSGLLGKDVPRLFSMIGIPLAGVTTGGFGGTFSSANVIFPLSTGFRPDLSPLATFSAKALYNVFPELLPPATRDAVRGAVTGLAGNEAITSSLWQLVMPNTFGQHVIEAAEATHDRGFATSMTNVLQALDYEQNEAVANWEKNGKKGPYPDIVPPPTAPADVRQRFLDKVRNQTRILYMTRALAGFVSPISVETQIQTFGLKTELNAEIKRQGSVSKGMTVFLKNNPEATPYTVPKSHALTGGTLPATQQAETWLDEHRTLVGKYQFAAAWLMPRPKATTFSMAVYDQQLASGLRVRTTPEQFLNALYTSAGEQLYYAAEQAHQARLTAIGKTYTAEQAEYTAYTAELRTLKASNPIWAANHTGGTKTDIARTSILQLQTMVRSGLVPHNTQAQQTLTVLQSYEDAELQYLQAGQGRHYAHDQSLVKNAWYNYVTSLKASHPNLQPVLTTVFEHALGTTTPTSRLL